MVAWVLVVNGNGEAAAEVHGVRLKYSVGQDEPSHRYQTLLLSILRAVAATTSKPSVAGVILPPTKAHTLRPSSRRCFELSRVLANLTATDGALVLDKRFGILGFGAEVSAELPAPEQVFRALDAEGRVRQAEEVENVGTRHRAAYRFVNDHPDGLAVVISQDGGVTFVANRERQIVFWEQSVSP